MEEVTLLAVCKALLRCLEDEFEGANGKCLICHVEPFSSEHAKDCMIGIARRTIAKEAESTTKDQQRTES